MKKQQPVVYVILVLAILLIPLLRTDTRSGVVSELDNRKLTEFPALERCGFTDSVESYLKDRIGFRRQMIYSYAVINNALAHELTHPIYTYGKDDYIFFKMHNNVAYNNYHKTFADMVLNLLTKIKC